MNVKVIKEIKGLVPGDVLYYNSNDEKYELNKTDYDISDEGQKTRSIRFSISSYLINEFKDYFVYLDDDGNEVQLNNIHYEDFPEYKNQPQEVPKNTDTTNESIEVSKLQEQIKKLEKELEIAKHTVYELPVLRNPFRYFWYF